MTKQELKDRIRKISEKYELTEDDLEIYITKDEGDIPFVGIDIKHGDIMFDIYPQDKEDIEFVCKNFTHEGSFSLGFLVELKEVVKEYFRKQRKD